jgi:hypothetical protein
MANITITIDHETLNRAHTKAQAESTSVQHVLLKFLQSYAGSSAEEEAAAVADIVELARQTNSRDLDQRWSRDELYERK